MRLCSFDIFDTVLTRRVALPWDIHVEVASALKECGLFQGSPREFLESRVDSENKARTRLESGEVNLAEIYAELASRCQWSPDQRDRAMTLELVTEMAALRSFPAGLHQVAHARKNSDRIAYISDMYLPAESLREVLQREGLWNPTDTLYVSHTHRCSKANQGLYRKVASEHSHPQSWIHTGDNSIADVECARREGITAQHFTAAHLSSDEKQLRGARPVVSAWRTRLAGAMRLARLSAHPSLSSVQQTIWQTSANVVGPLLTGFVLWCLEQAHKQSLHRLYFVARDGQILKRIADILAPAWGFNIECRYLYGSRQAWRPAAISELTPADLDWLAPTDLLHPLTPRQSFARFGSRPELFSDSLAAIGLPPSNWETLLDAKGIEALRNWYLQNKSRVLETTASRREELVNYLHQEGVLKDESFALVDIGWYGNLQRSLASALRAAGLESKSSLRGFYFGLFPSARNAGPSMTDYWSGDCPPDERIELQNITLFEVFTAADHGSVAGYRRNGVSMEPVLVELKNEAALNWGLETLQSGVLSFAQHWVDALAGAPPPADEVRSLVRNVYLRFFRSPTPEEARVWGSFPLGGQPIEHVKSQLVPDWSVADQRRALRNIHHRPTSWWMEGSLAANPDWILSAYLRLRRIRRRWMSGKEGK